MGPTAADISRFPIFEDGGRGHLGFSKFQIFNGGDGQEGRTTSPCQISSKSLETRLRYVSFNIMLVWLENAYSCPFLRGFGGTFPPNDVTHRPNPKKERPWVEPRHLSHKPRKSVARFELGIWTRKRTGQDRKKVTKGLYFTYLWRSPHWSDVHENLYIVFDVITCAKFQNEIFRVYDFSYWFWMGLTTVQRYCTALL